MGDVFLFNSNKVSYIPYYSGFFVLEQGLNELHFVRAKRDDASSNASPNFTNSLFLSFQWHLRDHNPEPPNFSLQFRATLCKHRFVTATAS